MQIFKYLESMDPVEQIGQLESYQKCKNNMEQRYNKKKNEKFAKLLTVI